MPGSILGNAVVRVEDPDLLVGKTTFIDNLPIEGVLHLAFVRSTVAHARLESIDVMESKLAAGFQDQDKGALDDADVVVRGRFVNQRVAVMPMEGNAVAVIPGSDGSDASPITCYVSTQMPHMWDGLMCRLLQLEPGS